MKIHRKNGQLMESSKVTESIERNYSDQSSIAGKLALSKAERFLQNNDVSAAIKVLEEIKYDSASAVQAKKRLADIFLVERRNEEKFIEIYQEICHRYPGEAGPLISLGDALIRINRAEESIRSYEGQRSDRFPDIQLMYPRFPSKIWR